ncbi:MAG TPA: hypothetical protein VGK67_25515, partial [Myxococcales bacterium]
MVASLAASDQKRSRDGCAQVHPVIVGNALWANLREADRKDREAAGIATEVAAIGGSGPGIGPFGTGHGRNWHGHRSTGTGYRRCCSTWS